MTSLHDAVPSDTVISDERSPLPRPPPTRFGQWRPALLARRGNRVEGPGLGAWVVRLRTVLWYDASDNVIAVGRNFRTQGLTIRVAGHGNRIEIGDDVRFSGRIEMLGLGARVRIGDRCDFKRTELLASHADIEIGRDCLVAAGVRLRTSDVHTIRDRASGLQVNPPRPVVVGDHVWLAAKATLLKGAHVPDGCVVGFGSVVTRGFEEPDCVLAGSPAGIVRRGIVWSR